MRSSFSIGGDQAKIWTDFRVTIHFQHRIRQFLRNVIFYNSKFIQELNVEHNHGDESADNNEQTDEVGKSFKDNLCM